MTGRVADSEVDRTLVGGQVLLHKLEQEAITVVITGARRLVGFVDLDLGQKAVRVPIQAVNPLAETGTEASLVSLEWEGDSCAILVRGDTDSEAVGQGLQAVAAVALRQFSAKLLN